MNQTYVYRKHLRASFKHMMLMELIILLVISIMLFGLIITGGQKLDRIGLIVFCFVMLIVFLFISLEMVLIYLLLLKRYKLISITLTDDAIEYTNFKGKIIIPYEDIERLEFPSIKYTGGWTKIIYKGGNIRVTVVLEHVGDFICKLKEKLNTREMAHVYNEKQLFSFYKTAVYSDESWERLYHNFKFQLATHYLCIILTIMIRLFYWNSSFNKPLIFGSLGIPLLGYLVSEIIIGVKVKKRVEREKLRLLPRNPDFERKVFKISMIVFSVGYLLILLIIR
ncbi:MAG: hypothetical protein CVV02_12450 [Firmicutes bacterium HGW-Firmicutes-7]|nr:MAG: hypothetical protein CVV02_12450 [Firmicutes bacterium HGW-Firmicutes-7]